MEVVCHSSRTFGQAAAVGAAQRIGVQRFEHAVPLALPQLLWPRPAAMAAAVAVAGGAVVTVHWVTSVVAGWQAHHAAVDTALRGVRGLMGEEGQ